jgi:hypothetical protein
MANGWSHESSAKTVPVEWHTPPSIFDALAIQFDLDPCAAPIFDYVPAKTKYVLPTDGLAEPWHGLVWCNPPYGKKTKIWLEKLAQHGNGIALVFARPDATWFQQAAISADVVCFISKRIKFINGNTGSDSGRPGAGSSLIGWGDRSAQAIIDSGLGVCVKAIKTADGS